MSPAPAYLLESWAVTPLFSLLLTIAAWLTGVALQRRTRWAAANPVLIAILIIGLVLRVLHISYATYFAGAQALNFLLGPAIVALAVPLVRAIEPIRQNLWPMLAALLAGAVTSMLTGYAVVRSMGGGRTLALSMLPKALTTPIALQVSQDIGGISSITVVLAILAGILVAATIHGIMRFLNIDEPGAVGLAAGNAGSGIGSSAVIAQHPLAAAFAAVALALNGVATAALAPLFAALLKRW